MSGSSANSLAARASAAYVDDDYESAVELYSQAIAASPDRADLYSGRSASFLQLDQELEAVDDATKAVSLDPNNSKFHARRGQALLALEEYEAAKEAYERAASLDPSAKHKYQKLIQKCNTEIDGEAVPPAAGHQATNGVAPADPLPSKSTAAPSPSHIPTTTADPNPPTPPNPTQGPAEPTKPPPQLCAASTGNKPAADQQQQQQQSAPAGPKYRHQHFQSGPYVEVAVLAKRLTPERVSVTIAAKHLDVVIRDTAGEEEYALHIDLYGDISPDDSRWELLSTKIEIRLKKTAAGVWPRLDQAERDPSSTAVSAPEPVDSRRSYPTSTRRVHKDWDQLAAEVKKEEKEEKLDGEAGLQKLFRDIYGNADEDTRRAMNKSFQESDGTVLSTNWKDIGARKVENASNKKEDKD